MVPSLEDLTYEERLERLCLSKLEKRREIDRDDLIVWDTRDTRGHRKKLMKTRCLRDIKKHSFPCRGIDTWIGLKRDI